jgi:hypothetical protein
MGKIPGSRAAGASPGKAKGKDVGAGVLDADGSYRVVRSFGYDEFRRRLG